MIATRRTLRSSLSLRSGLRYAHNAHHGHELKTYSSSYQLKTLEIDDLGGKKGLVSYIDEDCPDSPHPPLVLLGGTGQTINTFTPHIQGLRRQRRLVIVEMRGQGRTSLDSAHCNMPQLMQDLRTILHAIGIEQMHLCGFSFGGRVALTFAAQQPAMVRRLSVTAVPLHRPALGKLIIQSWEDALSRGNLRECAWSFLLNGYSADFIGKHHGKLPAFMDFVMKSNNITNLHNLVKFSHADFGEEYSLPHCAAKIACPTQIIAATEDRIAGYHETVLLAQTIKDCHLDTMQSGHLAPFEDPQAWRSKLLRFLDGSGHNRHS